MPWRGTALQARFLMASRFGTEGRGLGLGLPSWLLQKSLGSKLAAGASSQATTPAYPIYPGAASGCPHAHSPSHVSFPSMAAAPARAASVSRIAQRSLASRPAHSRGHPYVTRYPKASAITTQRKISAPARYACGTQCLVLRPCCTLKQQGLRRRAWAAHGRRIVPWRGTALQAPNPPDAGGNFSF